MIASRLAPLQQAVREAQDAAASSPRQRVKDLLDASLRFKIENRNLMSAAEDAGLSSPYQAEHYGWWHDVRRKELAQVPGVHAPDFTAHALLAAIRADLVAHLIDGQKMTPKALRSSLAAHVDNVLGNGPDPVGRPKEAWKSAPPPWSSSDGGPPHTDVCRRALRPCGRPGYSPNTADKVLVARSSGGSSMPNL